MTYYNASTIPYFNFTALWNITKEIKSFNAFDPRLFYPIDTETNLPDRSRTLLQPAACFSLVKDQKWVPYTLSDVHERVLVWKLPLFQLIAQIPRPPLGVAVECFSIIHLLGDPVDSLWSLLHKLMMCQKHAQQWRSQWSDARIWKTSALIEISYDEWEIGGIVKDRLHQALVEEACSLEEVEAIRSCYNFDSKKSSKTTIDFPGTERSVFRQCQEAAQSLAADRGTKALPILVALVFFVFAFIIAFAKATADLPDNKNVRTPHNIAFGAIYFWILPVVTLASIIGASQSQNAIPRILERLQEDVLLANGNKSSKFSLSSIDLRNPHTRTGGIYTWQMSKLKWSTYKGAGTSIKWTSAILFFLSLASVGSSFLIAVFISYQVPPTGWGCRGVLQSAIFASWIGSLACDFFFQMKLEHRPRLLFWTTFIKDIVVTVATLTMMLYSSIGVFNRCMCWTNFGRAPLSFGAEPVIAALLSRKLGHDWRYMASGGMLVQVFITTFACCLFSKGLVVLLQRDEDIPSASSFQEERRVPKSSDSQDDLIIGYLGHRDVKFGSDFHVDSKPL